MIDWDCTWKYIVIDKLSALKCHTGTWQFPAGPSVRATDRQLRGAALNLKLQLTEALLKLTTQVWSAKKPTHVAKCKLATVISDGGLIDLATSRSYL